MNERIRLIDAIVTLAGLELKKQERSVGALGALLEESVPLLLALKRRELLLARMREAQAGGPASTAALRASVAGLREQQDALRQAVILLKAAVGPALASAAACASRLQRTAAREH